MKPPKVIYLQVCGDCNDHDCDKCMFQELENVTWCREKIFDKDVAYFSEQAVRDLLRKEYNQTNKIINSLSNQTELFEEDLIIVDASIEKAIRELKGVKNE